MHAIFYLLHCNTSSFSVNVNALYVKKKTKMKNWKKHLYRSYIVSVLQYVGFCGTSIFNCHVLQRQTWKHQMSIHRTWSLPAMACHAYTWSSSGYYASTGCLSCLLLEQLHESSTMAFLWQLWSLVSCCISLVAELVHEHVLARRLCFHDFFTQTGKVEIKNNPHCVHDAILRLRCEWSISFHLPQRRWWCWCLTW